MGKKASKLIVLFVVLALFLGLFPVGNIEAAKKKSKTSITVSTQEELVKALKSGKYKKITIKTDAKVSFTLAAKYSNSDLKIDSVTGQLSVEQFQKITPNLLSTTIEYELE